MGLDMYLYRQRPGEPPIGEHHQRVEGWIWERIKEVTGEDSGKVRLKISIEVHPYEEP